MRGLGWVLFVLVLLGVVGCDHTTKHLAARELAFGEPVALIPGWLDLRYVANADTAFGLLKGFLGPSARFWVIVTTQAVVSIVLVAWTVSRWRASRTLDRVASAMLIGGALGNLLSRLTSGTVVDFIALSFWPVFNVADIAICVGAGLAMIAARRDGYRAPTAQGSG